MNDIQKKIFLEIVEHSENLYKKMRDMFSLASPMEVPDVFVAEWAFRHVERLSNFLLECERIRPAVTGEHVFNSSTARWKNYHPPSVAPEERQTAMENSFREIVSKTESLSSSFRNFLAAAPSGSSFDIFVVRWGEDAKEMLLPILRGADRLSHQMRFSERVESSSTAKERKTEIPQGKTHRIDEWSRGPALWNGGYASDLLKKPEPVRETLERMENKGYARKEVRADGSVHYCDTEGFLHRENGPALELPDGTTEWYRHGDLHREGGPAYERTDGTKIWYRDGERHREDGPAVERPDGFKEYWLSGNRVTEEEFHAVHPEAFASPETEEDSPGPRI